MIGLILAFAGLGVAAPGCHNAGPKVVCELDPPGPAPQAAAQAVKPVVLASIVRVRPATAPTKPITGLRPVRAAKRASPSAKPTLPPSDDEIQRRLASLVSIGDCTGARAYAHSIGEAKLANRAFSACAGMPDAPKLSYAIDIKPRSASVAPETNDAIIDQIPEMP
jgi:hypothetical protein